MATTGNNVSIGGTTTVTIFDQDAGDEPMHAIRVHHTSGAAVLAVKVHPLHHGVTAPNGVALRPGTSEVFTVGQGNGIHKVEVHNPSGLANFVSWGPVVRGTPDEVSELSRPTN